MNRSKELVYVTNEVKNLKELDLCEDLNNACELWLDVIETSTYKKDDTLYIPTTTYKDVITFIKWEIWKISRMLKDVRGTIE